MYAAVNTGLLAGQDLIPIIAEVSISAGLPSFSIVGLPTNAVTESRARVKAALTRQGFDFPSRKIVVNLAPADIRKDTSLFDLPIALGIVCALNPKLQASLTHTLCFGELSLEGDLCPSPLSLPLTLAAKRSGYGKVFLNAIDAPFAAHIRGIEVVGFQTVRSIVGHIAGETLRAASSPGQLNASAQTSLDFAEIIGLKQPKRAMQIAATGQHNVLMSGPPGCGKSMLGSRFHTILPPLSIEHALEVAAMEGCQSTRMSNHQIRVIAPNRSPHYSVTTAGLIGGGAVPKPGEISLAHRGVLFLDELLEFRKAQLEALRTPIEEKKVRLARSERAVCYPSDFILVAAYNPCPCGYFGSTTGRCHCTPRQLRAYQSRLSGPLTDRFDMHVSVESETAHTAASHATSQMDSETIRDMVIKAREFGFSNIVQDKRRLTAAAVHTLSLIERSQTYSFRRRTKLIKLAQTIANIERSVSLEQSHIEEAYHYAPKHQQSPSHQLPWSAS
jgi:magnesium chelatase family protein